MVEKRIDKGSINEISDNKTESFSVDIKNILDQSQMIKGKVFFVRHGMTVEEERRKRKKEGGEIIDGLLTQTAEIRLGEEGKQQIIEAANKLKPFLRGKIVFIYPADGEEEGILGGHERVNESLYLMLSKIYGKSLDDYGKSKLLILIENLKNEYGDNIEFLKTNLLNTTDKVIVQNDCGGKERLKDTKTEIVRKNLLVCSNIGELLGDKMIANCEFNTHFIVLGHKSAKGGVTNSLFTDDINLNIDFDINGGEIIDFDINYNGELHGKYCDHDGNEFISDYDVLYIKPSNVEEIVKGLECSDLHMSSAFGLKEALLFLLELKKSLNDGNLIVLQNQLNAYFRENPKTFKRYVLSDCGDLRYFCIGNLIKNKDFNFLKEYLSELMQDLGLKSFLQKALELEDDSEIKGIILDLIAEIDFIGGIENYKNEVLEDHIENIRKKSLDSRIVDGDDINPFFNIDGVEVDLDNLTYFINTDMEVYDTNIQYFEGKPGTGKSFLTCLMLEEIIKNKFEIKNKFGEVLKVFPFYVNLSGIRNPNDIIKILEELQERYYVGLPKKRFRYLNIFIFDGLDESLLNLNMLFDLIKKLFSNVVVTCRPGYFDDKLKGIVKKEINEFSPIQIDKFLGEYFKGDKGRIGEFNETIDGGNSCGGKKISLRSIGSNPLILSMMCVLVSSDQMFLGLKNNSLATDIEGKNKIWLYEKIIEFRLHYWNLGKEGREIYKGGKQLEDRKKMLAKIAYDSLVSGIITDDKYIKNLINDDHYGYVYGKDIESMNLIFRRSQDGNYDFVHESFREFFAMYYFVNKIENEDIFNELIEKFVNLGDNTIELMIELLIYRNKKEYFYNKVKYLKKGFRGDMRLMFKLCKEDFGNDMRYNIQYRGNSISNFHKLCYSSQKLLILKGGIPVLRNLFSVHLLSTSGQNREIYKILKFYDKEGKVMPPGHFQAYQSLYKEPSRYEFVYDIVSIVKNIGDQELWGYLVERSQEDDKLGDLLRSSIKRINLS